MRKNIEETRGRKRKLSDEQEREIRKSNLTIPQLAEFYNVSTGAIYKAFKNTKPVSV